MGFHKVTITAPYAATFPVAGADLLNSPPNPLYGLITFLHDSVPKKDRYTNDGVTYTWNAEVLLEMLSITLMAEVAQAGVEFYGVPLFIEIDLSANVPDQWRSTDENGDPVDQTWQEYFDQVVDNPIQIGDKTYTALSPNRRWLPFSEAVALNVTLITKPEIQALQAASQE